MAAREKNAKRELRKGMREIIRSIEQVAASLRRMGEAAAGNQ